MIRVALVDDEKECLLQLVDYIKAMRLTKIEYFAFEDMASLLDENKKGTFFDILFLDIEMEGINGINGANEIMKESNKPLIIFTTSHKQYVKEAFRLNAFQYMFKPISFSDFECEFQRAIDTVMLRHKKYVIDYNYEKISLDYSDIIYIETKDRHLVAKTTENEYVYNGTIKDEEKKLIGYQFVKIEQSCIVNLSHVKKINSTTVELDNGEVKYVSKRLYKSLYSAYNFYLTGCMI